MSIMGGTKNQSIDGNTQLNKFLQANDLKGLLQAHESLRKASKLADQATEKLQTRADVTKFIKKFQEHYQPFKETYQKLLDIHNQTLPAKKIETDSTEITKQTQEKVDMKPDIQK